ncbi:hypothetical protein KCU74_g15, partial [Aureobasidium melanogenum]
MPTPLSPLLVLIRDIIVIFDSRLGILCAHLLTTSRLVTITTTHRCSIIGHGLKVCHVIIHRKALEICFICFPFNSSHSYFKLTLEFLEPTLEHWSLHRSIAGMHEFFSQTEE